MKLHTSIQPRGDGTVIVEGFGKPLEFIPDAEGFLVCEVPNQAAATLLATGDFCPADPADYDQAVVLSTASQASAGEGGGESPEDEEPSDPNALPLEANTPPKV